MARPKLDIYQVSPETTIATPLPSPSTCTAFACIHLILAEVMTKRLQGAWSSATRPINCQPPAILVPVAF